MGAAAQHAARWYRPGTAWVTLNADTTLAGTDPDDVGPTTPHGRLTHPVPVGVLVHEAGRPHLLMEPTLTWPLDRREYP
ncbi:hypothetical protein [Thermomonospora umbrina]|uniref:Uncharacterized protein n=1 Tax=Thermomonospora umbrina TaxID=111806 RepID=A0A3D9SX89_9ACTN|nr:hypothetical protein [Thermomonospora umbrina]REF00573.1 hypothetical protein DFJ69_6123 [Thermomonospora umbrina]